MEERIPNPSSDAGPEMLSASPRLQNTEEDSGHHPQDAISFSGSSRSLVKVFGRIRPFISFEQHHKKSCIETTEDTIYVVGDSTSRRKTASFTFDRVFGVNSSQHDVFECARPVIQGVLQGYNGTVFAFGQTASGKTYTIQGSDVFEPAQQGILPRTIGYLFDAVAQTEEYMEFTIKLSCVEIYMERIRDLLNTSKNNLQIRQDGNRGVFLEDVTEEYVSSPHEMLGLIAEATANRAVSATGMNEASSRSHCVVTTIVEIRNTRTNEGTKVGKLHIVDLAGSESLRKSEATGQTAAETKIINKSLSALGNVIYQLTTSTKKSNWGFSSPLPHNGENAGNRAKEEWEQGSVTSGPSVTPSTASRRTAQSAKARYVSYRDSKLTRLLSESLGGNSRTVLIVCCSPAIINLSETLTSLRFGDRAKRIRNKATVNRIRTEKEMEALLTKAEAAIDAQATVIRNLTEQNSQLKAKGKEAQITKTTLEQELQKWKQKCNELEHKLTSKGVRLPDHSDKAKYTGVEVSAALPINRLNLRDGVPYLKRVRAHDQSILPDVSLNVSSSNDQDAVELVTLRKSCREMETQLKELKQQLSEKEMEVNSLSASLAESESILTELRGSLNEQQEKAQEATNAAKGHQAALAAAQKTEEVLSGILHGELKESRSTADRLGLEKKELEDQVRQLQERLEDQHQEHQKQSHELRMRIAHLKNKIKTAPLEKATNIEPQVAAQLKELRHQSDHRLFKYTEIKFQADELLSAHRQIGRKYAVLDQEYNSTRKLLQARGNRLKQLQASYVTNSSDSRKLRADHARFSQELHRLLGLLKQCITSQPPSSVQIIDTVYEVEEWLQPPQNSSHSQTNSPGIVSNHATPHVVKPLRGGQSKMQLFPRSESRETGRFTFVESSTAEATAIGKHRQTNPRALSGKTTKATEEFIGLQGQKSEAPQE